MAVFSTLIRGQGKPRSIRKFLKDTPEIIPVITAVGIGCAGAVARMIYVMATDPDVNYRRVKEDESWKQKVEAMDKKQSESK